MDSWQVRVVLRVHEVERAVRFYRDTLGLRLLERWEQPAAPGAIFDTGRGQIEVYAANGADEPATVPPTIMLLTADADQEYLRLRYAGVPALWGPATTSWSTRQFAVQDPDGTVLVFCSPAPAAGEPPA
jgi:catechol 2,3-dioxygenase-like lactoylglutathione lyase family enzyme